jgi:pyruvate dehydrogenase E2 component (dihydrolipoamide acetyltransferase)
MAVEVFMPKMTDFMEAGEVIRWLAQEGDRVEEGQPIMELLTDKVVAELEAPACGVLKGIRAGVEAGTIVPVGEAMAFIVQPDEEVPALPPLRRSEVLRAGPQGKALRAEEGVRRPPSRTRPAPATAEGGRMRATPVARRVARELGVDLALVKGTGPGGRIREEDVRAFAQTAAAAPAPQPDGAGAEWLELTPIQRVTGQRMLQSIQEAPQFALTVSVDMANMLGLRESLMEQMVAKTGERLSITAILVKVVGTALRQYPRANVSFVEGRIKVHPQVNLGVAMGSDGGLIVPVIKEADQKSLTQITRELKTLREKAQQMRFSAEDLAGGTFTISNLGMCGIDHFTAIINPPQSAILAVGRIIKTPVGMPDDTIALRPMMHLTLTVDHRAMDGLQGATFLAQVKSRLEQPYLLL